MWKKFEEWRAWSRSQNVENNNNIENKNNIEFVKIKVEEKQTIEVHNDSAYKQQEIDIVIKSHDCKKLPRQDVDALNPEKMPD